VKKLIALALLLLAAATAGAQDYTRTKRTKTVAKEGPPEFSLNLTFSCAVSDNTILDVACSSNGTTLQMDIVWPSVANWYILAANGVGAPGWMAMAATHLPAETGEVTRPAGSAVNTLDKTAVTNQTIEESVAPADDLLLLHDASAAALRAVYPGTIRGGRGGGSWYEELLGVNTTTGLDFGIGAAGEGAGTGSGNVTGTADHPGIKSISTGTTATGGNAYQTAGNASSAVSSTLLAGVIFGGGKWVSGVNVQFNTTSTATQAFTAFAGGFSNMVWTTVGAKTEGSAGAYFRCVDCRVGVGEWVGVVRVGGADAGTCDTNTVFVEDQYHSYVTVTTANGGATGFYYDGTLVCTTTVAHGTGTTVVQPVGILKTVGTTAITANVDAYWGYFSLTNTR
jgi:hypothetical protein